MQVASAAEPGKAPPVTPRPLLKRRTAILTPGAPGRNLARSTPEAERAEAGADHGRGHGRALPAELGLILRTAAALPRSTRSAPTSPRCWRTGRRSPRRARPPAWSLAAPDAARRRPREWTEVPLDRVVTEAGALARAGVWEAIAALRRPAGRRCRAARTMAIEPTRALVAVDVNTGPDLSPAAALKASINAARELPRQLRLRGLGGQVAIDFAPLRNGSGRRSRARSRPRSPPTRSTPPSPAGPRSGIWSCSAGGRAGPWSSSGPADRTHPGTLPETKVCGPAPP